MIRGREKVSHQIGHDGWYKPDSKFSVLLCLTVSTAGSNEGQKKKRKTEQNSADSGESKHQLEGICIEG